MTTATAQITPLENSPLTLGGIIDKLSEIREARRALNERDKELSKEFELLKTELLARYEAEGTNSASGHVATASVTRTVVPTVKNWDLLYAYILETGQLHLLEKRVATGAFREVNNAGSEIPGVEPFTKTDISLRNN